jgi:pyroglutamyl-peptidase
MPIDVLLSGFEPFAGAEINESWEAVRRAEPVLRERGLTVRALELPVVFDRGADVLLRAVADSRPRLVVATGLAAGRSGITPERVAINIQDARIPDNAGRSPIDAPSVPGGPVGYFSSLPIKAMVEAARGADVPASVSQTAGTFVCNDVFYRLCHALQETDHHRALPTNASADASADPAAEPSAERSGIRGGFVHVPSADVVDPEAAARALVAMVETALGTSEDLSVTGGVES